MKLRIKSAPFHGIVGKNESSHPLFKANIAIFGEAIRKIHISEKRTVNKVLLQGNLSEGNVTNHQEV